MKIAKILLFMILSAVLFFSCQMNFDDKVVSGFGSFSVARSARSGRNPQTAQAVIVPVNIVCIG